MLLQHPLAIEDDMRLVSTVELMAIRERVNNNLLPIDRPIDDHTFNVLREADGEFNNWYTTWDKAFSQKYENAGESTVVTPTKVYEMVIQLFIARACRCSISTLNCITMRLLSEV